ncbi:choice-of-anchor D domain-containing protein [uncultured Microscilla sp.]|uniref:choice-of-anchor D domain-containing protein n=1 Tax=uncultured Microscilla sp. TaxID=432653 RepID=UPI002607E548|nr:choice-of-anchor D domain-containing protein [uncultured Microscilla sp.]
MQQTQFYNAQRLWSILMALCLLAPLQLTAQTALILKDTVGTKIDGTGDGELNAPKKIVFNDDGSFWVVDAGNDRVQKFDKDGKFVTKFGTPGAGNGQFSSPYSITKDSQGNIYVTDSGNDNVQKFDKDGGHLKTFGGNGTTDGKFESPRGIVIDASGNIYIADGPNNRIQKFDKDDNFVSKFGTAGTGDGQFDFPDEMAMDADGNLYIIDRNNKRVQKFDKDGKYLAQFGGAGTTDGKFDNIQGIAIDKDGFIYVGEGGTRDIIQVFDSNGNFKTKFNSNNEANGNKVETHLTFDANGQLYISETIGDRIRIMAPAQEINLKAGTTAVASGSTVDFGSVVVSQSSDKTFTIENLGGIDLTLSGTSGSQVAVSGTNATDFVVTQTSVTDKITGFSNVTFSVSYKPAGLGASTAALTISSNDADEGTYTINLTGTATSNVTGVSPDLKEGILTVGPNPTQGKLHLSIEGKASGNISYQVVNMQGQTVAKGAPRKGSIDMGSLPAGNYVLLLQIGDEQVVRRIQKK